jgi:hypothetical protein
MSYGGTDASGGVILGFLIGAGVGFVIASLIVSISMNLREIALNTRQLVELNSGSASVTVPDPEMKAEPSKRKEDPNYRPFSKVALNRAKQEGYSLRINASGRVIVIERGQEGEFYFTSNGDIEELAKVKGWI